MKNLFVHTVAIAVIFLSATSISLAETLFSLSLNHKSKELKETISKQKLASFNTNWIADNSFSVLTFPADKQKVKDFLNWGSKGFALEVWTFPEIDNGGYVVLKKGSFGYPAFRKNGKITFYIVDDTQKTWTPTIKGEKSKANTWQHYVFSGGKNFIQAYYNGKLAMSAKRSGIPAINSNPLFVGQSDGWGNNFKGKIGLIRIYKRALSTNEVARHYQILNSGRKLPSSSDIIYELPKNQPPMAMAFNGQSSYLALNMLKLNTTGPVNVSVTAYVEKLKSTQQYLTDINKKIGLYLDNKGYLKAKIKTDKGVFTATSSIRCIPKQWYAFKAVWNGKYLQIFIDGKPSGYCILTKGTLFSENTSVLIGTDSSKKSFFDGKLVSVKITNDNFKQEIGTPVSASAVNRDCDRFKNKRSRHLKGEVEKQKPLVDFEDLAGWTVISQKNIVCGKLYRSREEPLWGKFVARLDLQKGPYKLREINKVIIKPPRPIKIDKNFNAINIWMFAPSFSKKLRPTLKLSFQVADAFGKIHNLKMNPKDFTWLHWRGWCIWHKSLSYNIKAPAKMLSMTFYNFNEAKKTIYFDSLCFYKRDIAKLKNCNIPNWQDIGIPIKKDTILPSLNNNQYRNYVKKHGQKYILGYTGLKQTLEYTFLPKTGFLNDIKAKSEGKTFTPLQNGGWYFVVNGKGIPAGDKRIKAKLLAVNSVNNKIKAEWEYLIADKKINSTWTLWIKGKTLIIDLKADSTCINEFRCGKVAGLQKTKVIEVPYLNLGGWRHKSTAPGILNSGKLFVSCFLDWYNSNASELFGMRGAETKSRFIINLVNGDGKWVPVKSPNSQKQRELIINGGACYLKNNNNKRNSPHERIFLTVSNNFDETLPNIPHPPSKWLDKTKKYLWATRMWYLKKFPKMDYYDKEFAFWQKLSHYGIKNVNVRFHGSLYRMYIPQRNGDPISCIKTTEPQIGGDKALRHFFDKMKKIGFNVGLYTNHTLLAPLSYEAWDENHLTLDAASDWTYGSNSYLQVKNSRMLGLQKKYNSIYKKKFNPNCSYLDQITCPPVWRYTDYDTRAPEAGKFNPAYRAFIKCLQSESEDFSGPVLSEGKMHWMFAGLCDNYAQPQRPDIHLLPNFQLKKLHLLSNDCGYHLDVVSRWHAAGVNKLLAYEIAYGNIGHLYGVYHFGPPHKIKSYTLKSYFMIQQLQQFYATVPIKNIKYNSKMGLVDIEDAIRLDAINNNQVLLEYENGLKIFVNLNKNKNWNVTLNDSRYILPPFGYAAELPGKILEYSSLVDGRRIDYVTGSEWTYCNANGKTYNFGPIECKHTYLIKPVKNGLSITPEPYIKDETITINLKQLMKYHSNKTFYIYNQNNLGDVIDKKVLKIDKNGSFNVKIKAKSFKYTIKQK